MAVPHEPQGIGCDLARGKDGRRWTATGSADRGRACLVNDVALTVIVCGASLSMLLAVLLAKFFEVID